MTCSLHYCFIDCFSMAVRSLDPWEVYVRPHMEALVNGLKVDEILEALYSRRLISKREYDKIRSFNINTEKARYLLADCLFPTQSDQEYTAFLSILNESISCKRFASLLSPNKQEDMQSALNNVLESQITKALKPFRWEFDYFKKVLYDTADMVSDVVSERRPRKMPSFPLASRRAARSASTSFSKSETDLTTTRSVQAYQDVLSPRKTKLVPAQPPETSLKRETLTVFIPPGYKKDLLQMEEALEKLVRKHLKLFLNLRFLNPDDSSKPEKSLILAASNIVNISLVFIGMSALDFEGKELSNEFLSLLIGVFPKLRIEVSSVESDVVEFCAQMFSKDILSLLEFFDDEPLQQAFAACLWYQFSSLKEMRVRIDCLPQWTLDIEKSRQLHEDFPREGIVITRDISVENALTAFGRNHIRR